MTLDELATHHGTDKGVGSHWYTRHYDRIFSKIRLNVEVVCEIGVGNGASLKMWRDYFPNAFIHGVDHNPQENFGDRIFCHHIEQTECDRLTEAFKDRRLEIIIDDASHEQDRTFKTLDCMFKVLEPRGWYVIEDMVKDTYPPKIGQWLGDNQSQVQHFYMIDNKDHGCVISFIQKR